MASKRWECAVCGYVYDEAKEGVAWEDLPDDWECPVCGAAKSEFEPVESAAADAQAEPEADAGPGGTYLSEWARSASAEEPFMADIHRMAVSGESIVEPMRTPIALPLWNDVLIKGAQLARLPLNQDEAVDTRTVIGPRAAHPLVIEMPLYVSHMSFGALSKEAKFALAKGSAAVRTAMCSGEGGILPESLKSAYKYIFEYVPNRYSVTEENLQAADAIEIKIGQSAKPGMGGHLPAEKVTDEIAAVRGFPAGKSITSPARFDDIRDRDDLKKKVEWLRDSSGGKPIGIKLAAGDIEADLEVALHAKPDFVTLDGRPGATAAAPKFVKAATSIPTLYALHRAAKYLARHAGDDVSLLITGGLRVSSDFAKALALGADAVALASAALMACACQQYRVCNTGRCPVGVATQDPELRARLDIEKSAERLANYLRVCNEELKEFARLTGNGNVHDLAIRDLCTVSSEIATHTDIEHAAAGPSGA
jgi:glutamate synthase domain-containing protein 2/rubredoxin